VLPVYAAERFGSAAALGVAVAGFGAGAVLGSLAYGAVAHRLPRRATFVGAFLCVALSIAGLASTPGLAGTTAALVAVGIASGPLNPILMTLFQERIPKEIYGQALGIIVAVALSAAPLGILAAGVANERAGVETTIAVIAGCYLVVTASMLVNPAFRDMGPPGQ
jgi:MFS family permease